MGALVKSNIIRKKNVFTSIEQKPITDAKIDTTGAFSCQKHRFKLVENAEVVSYLT